MCSNEQGYYQGQQSPVDAIYAMRDTLIGQGVEGPFTMKIGNLAWIALKADPVFKNVAIVNLIGNIARIGRDITVEVCHATP